VLVLVLVGAFAVLAHRTTGDNAAIDQPAAAAIVHQVTAVSRAVLAAVGTGTLPTGAPLPNALRAVSGPPLATEGKPQVLYIGADFCPVCAASRWSLVNALSRFGTFSDLHYTRSAVDDGDLASFTFHGSRYTSPYLHFVAVEHEDRTRGPLDPLTGEQTQLLATLGGNGYPFVDIAGRYVNRAPDAFPGGFDPNVLQGKDWAQIAGALQQASDPIT
jgi:hypothetical protein